MKKIICMFILLISFVLFACGKNQTLTFENTSLNLKVGEIVELSPVVTNAENEKVNYVSLNEDVVKIKDSKIIALTTGSTTVIASLEENKEPSKVVKELGMTQITDDKTIRDIVVKVLDEHPDLIEDHRKGKNTFDFFVGQVMKATRGQANPGLTANIIREEIEKR